MTSGVGIAVGVSLEPIDAAPWPEDLVDPDATSDVEPLAAWLPRRRTSAESASLLQQITAAEAQLAALKLDLVLDIAAERPAPADPRPGEARAADVGPPGTSEFALDELALVLNTSRTAAVTLFDQGHVLATRLPATRAELATGRLDWPRARAIAAELGRPADETDPVIVAAVEAAVLPVATELSVRQLRELVRRELAARDAEAADRRREQARKAADVGVRNLGNGMSELTMLMPHPEARACRQASTRTPAKRRRRGTGGRSACSASAPASTSSFARGRSSPRSPRT